jgi:hypothetical protein
MDQRVVLRGFVVPMIAVAIMSSLADAAGELDPASGVRLGGGSTGLALAVGRTQRIGGKERQDVGEKQLLMLLLVVDSDLDQARDFGREAAASKLCQRLIDMRAVGKHALARGPCQDTAAPPGLTLPLALVVGVEAVVEGIVERLVTGEMLLQDELLEEPGDVREVPLGGARIVHGLDGHVLRR